MGLRTDKHLWLLDLAERCARQGSCCRRNYGAIIVDHEGCVVSTGYTGAPKGQPHCEELGPCYREVNKIPSGSNYNKCRSVHAEMNALIQAGKNARGGTLYLVGVDAKSGEKIYNHKNPWPCYLCSKMIVNSGLKYFVYRLSETKYSIVTVTRMYREAEFLELGKLGKQEKWILSKDDCGEVPH